MTNSTQTNQKQNNEVFPFEIKSTGQDFDEVWYIYTHSFPKEEQRDLKTQLEFFKDPNYSLYGFKNSDDVTVGFLTTWKLSENYLLIAYFAIHPDYRANGYGSTILKNFIAFQNFPGEIILEVDDPEHNSKPDICEKRIKFYNKNDFVLNSKYKYVQPPMKEEDKNAPDFRGPRLILMSHKNEIKEQFKNVHKIIFEKYYKFNKMNKC
jgi:GNAT superfamily N-acetyltransferase